MKQALSRLSVVFVVAFTLNFIWEHLHAMLYVHYRGGPITDAILMHATFFDATFTTFVALPLVFFPKFRRWLSLGPILASVYAVFLEQFALMTDRWEYTEAMPIIPILSVGLSPAVQLGLIAYVAFRLAFDPKKT